MASPLRDFVGTLDKYGVYDVALPFLLVFTLAFAMLEKSKILGDKGRSLNVIISLALAFFFVRNNYLVALINRFLPNVSFFMVVMLMGLLLLGIVYGKKYEGLQGGMLTIAVVLAILFIIWSLTSDLVGKSGINLPPFLTNMSSETKGLVIFVAAMVIVISWAVKGEKQGDPGAPEKVSKMLGGGWK